MIGTATLAIFFNSIITSKTIDYIKITPYPYGSSEPIGLKNLLEGIDYLIELLSDGWTRISETGSLSVNNFTMTLTGLESGATYQYRAFIKSNDYGYTGSTKEIYIPLPPVITPSLQTQHNTSNTTTSLLGTGGKNIIRYEDVSWYGMQYSAVTTATPFSVTPTLFSHVLAVQTTAHVNIFGDITNTYSVSAVSGSTPISWIVPQTPVSPTPSGISQQILICTNTGTARTGCTVYTPTIGSPQIVVIKQSNGLSLNNAINVNCVGGSSTTFDSSQCGRLCPTSTMSSGQCYFGTFSWEMNKPFTPLPARMSVCLLCNGSCLYGCCYYGKLSETCSGTWSGLKVDYNDVIELRTCTNIGSSSFSYPIESCVRLSNVTNGVGSFCVGSPSYTCSSIGI